jgi:hypothetical protein
MQWQGDSKVLLVPTDEKMKEIKEEFYNLLVQNINQIVQTSK